MTVRSKHGSQVPSWKANRVLSAFALILCLWWWGVEGRSYPWGEMPTCEIWGNYPNTHRPSITDIQFRSLTVSACSLAACCLEYMYTPKENFYVPNASHKHAQKVSLKFKNASDQILMTCFSDFVVTQSYFRYFTQFNELWQHSQIYVYSG